VKNVWIENYGKKQGVNNKKVGEVFYPIIPCGLLIFCPVDKIETNASQHEIRKNNYINVQDHTL